jgi:predicted nucleotidyltransferase
MATDPTRDDAAKPASGRFVLRLPPGLHAALREAATAAGTSLNDYCTRKLAVPLGGFAGLEEGSALVERATRVLGPRLVGLVAFGSWARGEAGPGSDLDLLVVVDPELPLRRELYRRWGDADVSAAGLRVEPHFVHLPPHDALSSGVWAEAALDGIVLFERELIVSRRLGRVRRHIAEGRIVRRVAHGQPYWTEAA